MEGIEHPPSRRERKPQAQSPATRVAVAWAVLLCAAPLALAGRPLYSGDAATADAGTCQVEVWSARDGAGSDPRARSAVLASACGVAVGLEHGADHTRFSARRTQPDQAGLALKWAPTAWRAGSAAGELNFGLELSSSWVKAGGASWQHAQASALVLVTWKAGETRRDHHHARQPWRGARPRLAHPRQAAESGRGVDAAR